MKNVKTPRSDSYQDYLIESLKNRVHAAAYLTVHLEDEEGDAEEELLHLALSNGCGQKQLVRGDSRGVQGEAFGESICKFMSSFVARMLRPYRGVRQLGDPRNDQRVLTTPLSNVFQALGEPNMSPPSAKLHLDKLDDLLSKSGSAVLYSLTDWLATLGLKLTVTVNEDLGDNGD